MPTPEIIENIRRLRTEVAEVEPAAPEVAHIATAIDAVLVEPSHAPHYQGLRDRLRAVSGNIESRHPELAASMNAVMNALSAAGI